MKPTIGRIVHYVIPPGTIGEDEHRAAIISQVHSGGLVNLSLFKGQSTDLLSTSYPAGFFGGCILFDVDHPVCLLGSVFEDQDHKTPGTWHWPERED
jgi:hypothetical protein